MATYPNNSSRAIALNGVGYGSRTLAYFGFGGLEVSVEVTPHEPAGLIPLGRQLKNVKITVTYREKHWVKRYVISEDNAGILIKVSKIVSKVINTISIRISNIKFAIDKFGKIIVRYRKGQ